MNKLANFSDFALSRAEMKEVTGGCAVYLPSGWKAAKSFSWSSTGTYTQNADGSRVITGLSQASVNNFMAGGGRWCCSSCSGASWL